MGRWLFVYLLMGLLLIQTSVGAAVQSHYVRPIACYYCSTADPLGLTYTDSHAARPIRLCVSVVEDVLSGPDGHIAAQLEDDTLAVYRHGELVCSLRPNNHTLVGWIGHRLALSSNVGYYLWDPANGVERPLPFSSATVTIRCASDRLFHVEQRGDTVTTWSAVRHARPRQWTTRGRCSLSHQVTYVDDRYCVVEVFPAQSGVVRSNRSFLWVIDAKRDVSKSMHVPGLLLGVCPGKSDHELLVSVSGRVGGPMKDVQSSRILSLDMRTMRWRVVARAVGSVSPIGWTSDRAWLLATRLYQESGPGRPSRLIALRLADGKVQVLQENVYEVFVAE